MKKILLTLFILLANIVFADIDVRDATGASVPMGTGNGTVDNATSQVVEATDSLLTTNSTAIKNAVESLDTSAVTISNSVLPTGSATSSLQTLGNTSLTTIAGDTTSLDAKIVSCDTTGKATSVKQDEIKAALDLLAPVELLKASNGTSPITTAVTTNAITAPGAGNHLRVYKVYAQNSSETDVKVSLLETGGVVFFSQTLSQYQPLGFGIGNGAYLKVTSATGFDLITSAAGSVDYTILYSVNAD